MPATLGKVLDEVFGGLPAEPQLTAIADVGAGGRAQARRW